MQGRLQQVVTDDRHYLERELEALVSDPWIWRFMRAGSLDGIWYRDLERPGQEWMSPEFWGLLGIDPATRPHHTSAWQALIHPDDLARATANLNAHCADPAHAYDQVVRFNHSNGATIWLRCRGLAIRRPDGTPIRMLGAHRDVTPLKRASTLLEADDAAARAVDEELQAFAYSASHDLKSPANTIRMLLLEARRALRNGLPEDADVMLERAETTNETMRTMVDQALDYTRRAGSAQTHGPVDLDHLLADVIDTLIADIMEVRADVSADRFGTVIGCEWQLRRMFQNLISNALKFQPAGRVPVVAIRAVDAAPGRCGIEIADNGIGIAADDQVRIFELFTRLHRASAYAGSGIGLAFCARVSRQHGSEITVRSRVGQGTVFSLSLPIPEKTIA